MYFLRELVEFGRVPQIGRYRHVLVREPEIHRDAAHEGRRVAACEQFAAQVA